MFSTTADHSSDTIIFSDFLFSDIKMRGGGGGGGEAYLTREFGGNTDANQW